MYRIHSHHSMSVVALTLLLASVGCSVSPTAPVTPASAINITGNWQFASTSQAALTLPSLSGSLTGSGKTITGILHSDALTACANPATPIQVTGSASAANILTLTGPVAGGIFTLTGTLAPTGKSLTNATYSVKGGTCAFVAPADVTTATNFQPISGNYAGTFSDPDGQLIAITAALSQTPASDPNGNFQLTGSGSFGPNPCFSSPVTISSTQVTGGTFSLTYADSSTGNSVTASGTFTPDGATLNVTTWSLTGSCGPDHGTGTLTKQ